MARQPAEERWVGTWATSPVPVEDKLGFDNQTIRMVTRISLGGRRLRIRLSNAHGGGKLTIGAASIGIRDRGANAVPGSLRPITFGGAKEAVIAAGAPLISDPVALDVPPLCDLLVSLHVPGQVPESFQVTGHRNSHQTNYLSGPGDSTRSEKIGVAEETQAWCFLSGIDVLAPAGTPGIVCFGDSLTDGNLSALDANHRWPDQLARRLLAPGGRPAGVMNQGVGGNRILHDRRGESGLRRFDRDALAQTGVSHIIVFIGTNDIRNQGGNAAEKVNGPQMIAGFAQLALRAHACGIKIFGATLLPFENETYFPGVYTAEGEAARQAVNDWMRKSGAFDAVVDFDGALRDPEHPLSMLPRWDCGDHLHPSDDGYLHMGDSIDLNLFKLFK